MESEHRKLLRDCTEEQRKVYDAVLESVQSGSGGLFFVYGSGGCGKTFLWRTLICDSVCYLSVDSAEEFGGTDEDLNQAFPVEYLNSLNVAGLPHHNLKLKVGGVVMLMRNLNQILECEVIYGTFAGTKHFIPRMELSSKDMKMPFKLVRKQMPLQLCYAMTINKSQGQSLKKVELYLSKSVFTHGQYYVAVSRVTSPSRLTIFVDDESGVAINVTQNFVYKEVFYSLPHG
ncbi:uncharacterized protein LOC141714078 [Apium graveolens]|uniref:uncharacterized protein LOC141714078 n=1 Tax=Apium graveolens TaxID=4045 RepID=UPI003D79F723